MNNIRHIRERLGLSQGEFAEGIGTTQGNVSHYECFRQEVPPDVARRVIALAESKDVHIGFDDIYAKQPQPGAAETAKAA